MISAIIVTAVFIGVILLIITNKLNRAIATLAGAVITYFVLTFIEGADFLVFIDFLVGTQADGYVNLRVILLIVGMLFIVQVCHSAGVFQFLAFKLIQTTKGKPMYLLFMFCALSVLVSAILNNILAVIILIPLTIVASRILGIDPVPYIICEAIMVNVGGTIFSISSIPNILIVTYAGISFADFFINIGLFAFFIFAITFIFFMISYRKKLMIPKQRLTEVLQDFNVWNYVPSRGLFYRSIAVLVGVMVAFVIIPSTLLSPDMIALTGGIALVILSKLNGREIIKKIDLELLLYLLGVFVITGAMELLNVVDLVGTGIIGITGSNAFLTVIVILWVSAFLSSSIDNIPITKVLIPVVDVVSMGFTPTNLNTTYYSLAFGANLGDNLTPMGDNMLVMSISEQRERPITYSQFFKLGFIATILQLIAVTLYFIFLYDLVLGGLIILSIFVLTLIILLLRYLNKNYKEEEQLIKRLFNRLKNQDFKRERRTTLKRFLGNINKFIKDRLGIGAD